VPETCNNCGSVIPQGHDSSGTQPCPNCGQETGRIVELSVSVGLGLDASAMWSSVRGHTGREVKGDQAYGYAVEWASLNTRDQLFAHAAAEDFRSLVAKASCLTDETLTLFRGRSVDCEPPSPEQMGPPPLELATRGGRYDRPGDHVLYLSDSEDGVLREYDRWHKSGSPYIQRFCLRTMLHDLRIADFTSGPADHLVTAVFAKAEDCNVSGRAPESYLFSQTVAELVAEQFDGMRVPGVGGAPGAHYSNVVVFRPHPSWVAWIEPGAIPYRPART
jgi:hypothetical protein